MAEQFAGFAKLLMKDWIVDYDLFMANEILAISFIEMEQALSRKLTIFAEHVLTHTSLLRVAPLQNTEDLPSRRLQKPYQT